MDNAEIKNLITSYDELLDNLKYISYVYNYIPRLDEILKGCSGIYFSIRCAENKKYVLSSFLNPVSKVTARKDYSYFNELLDDIHSELQYFDSSHKFFITFETSYNSEVISSRHESLKTINFSKEDLIETFIFLGSKNININNYY